MKSLTVFAVVILILSFFLTKEQGFALTTAFVVFKIGKDKEIVTKSLSTLFPIFLLMIVGAVMGTNNNVWDWVRDIYIMLKNISYFIAGILLTRYIKNLSLFYKYIGIMAIIFAFIHIVEFAQNYSSTVDLDVLRADIGRGNLIEAIFLAMYVAGRFNKKFRILIERKSNIHIFFIGIVFISFIAYFSRSMIVSFLILSLFMFNILNVRDLRFKGNLRLFRTSLFLAVIVIGIGSIGVFSSGSSSSGWLIDKFENIPNEVFWSDAKNKNASLGDINQNWRGYESYRGVLKYYDGSIAQKIAGYGWGSLVDLGLTISLGGKEFDFIPVMHNGYITLLVKTGIFGIIIYLIFFYRIAFLDKEKMYKDLEIYYLYQMLSAIGVMTLVNTFTIAGLLSVGDAITPVMLGLFWGLIQRKLRFNFNRSRQIRKSQLAML